MSIIIAFLFAQLAAMSAAAFVSRKGERWSQALRLLVPAAVSWFGLSMYLCYMAAVNHARISLDPFWAGVGGIANLAAVALGAKLSARKTK